VLKLRASGCTLSQISDFLRINGVAVTLSTIAKYLHKQLPQRVPAVENSAPGSPAAQISPPTAPACQAVSPPPVISTPQTVPEKQEPATSSELSGFKNIEQLRQENPTLPAIQITKMYAQQYAGPVIDSTQLEEMKRKYRSR
jgi:hypothetical protein